MLTPLEGPYVLCHGKKMLNFASHDYLGLSQHPEVKKNAIKYTLRYGVGTFSAPFSSAPQKQVEEKLAHFLGATGAVLFHTYEQALSSIGKQKPLDDSHAFGILGPKGFGMGAHRNDVDFIVGSLENGGGCSGAYLAYRKPIEISKRPNLSPAIIGAIDGALNLIPEMDQERKSLEQKTEWLCAELQDKGWQTSSSPFPVVTFNSGEDTEKVMAIFSEADIFALANSKQITLILTALHTPDDLDQLATVLKRLTAADLALATQSLTPAP